MFIVAGDGHRAHDPVTEASHGIVVPNHERAARAEAIRAALAGDDAFRAVGPRPHGLGPVRAVHDDALVDHLARAWGSFRAAVAGAGAAIADTFAHAMLRDGMGAWADQRPRASPGDVGRWCFDTATPIVAGTFGAACEAVDVGLTALEHVLAGERAAYALCRPPGHHAARAVHGGYCYFNNAAIAAHHAVATTGARVGVLDVDYHHGNGTQQVFYRRGDVTYVSLHADPAYAYPYFTGFADEQGAGPGLGANRNLPLPPGTDDGAWGDALTEALAAIEAARPDLLVVSLGVDTYALDPIADFRLSAEAFHASGRLVGGLGLPTLVVQEGGYHVGHLGANVRAWLRGLAGLAA